MNVVCADGVAILLRALAMAVYPNEGCGILLGKFSETVYVTDVVNGHNLWAERSRDRYNLDPQDILRAERLAKERGVDVVGFWHSHPDHPAQPSQFDSDHAWVDYVYLICATTEQGSQELNSFTLPDEGGVLTQVSFEERKAVAL